jgi:hypothetical protein
MENGTGLLGFSSASGGRHKYSKLMVEYDCTELVVQGEDKEYWRGGNIVDTKTNK